MKTLLYRGSVIPLVCLPEGTKISRIRTMYSIKSGRKLKRSFQIVTLPTKRKVKVILNAERLPLNVVLKHLTT